jgi:hypothetical protein
MSWTLPCSRKPSIESTESRHGAIQKWYQQGSNPSSLLGEELGFHGGGLFSGWQWWKCVDPFLLLFPSFQDLQLSCEWEALFFILSQLSTSFGVRLQRVRRC